MTSLEGGVVEIDIQELETSSKAAPIITLVNLVLLEGVRRGASHIIIEPGRVQFLLNGDVLGETRPPLKIHKHTVRRVKLMGGLLLEDPRRVHHGRLRARLRKDDQLREVVFTITCRPTSSDEVVVLERAGRNE